jgi:hypothetical protein
MVDIQRIMGNPKLRTAFLIFAATLCVFWVVELTLNLWIRASIKTGLAGAGNPDAKVTVALDWMGLKDIWRGKISRIKIDAQNCRISNLDYQRLSLDNQGFSLDLPVLLKEKRLAITSIEKTKISASVSEQALADYINRLHPGYGVGVKIQPSRLQLSGCFLLFGKKVPVVLEGGLVNLAPKTIEFHPSGLSVAKQWISGEVVSFISNQLPVQFAIMENWPLMITRIQLNQGIVSISLKEYH